ncbi:cupin domain-containing protein [Rhodopirellula halodulae]|uniref:cupin domain-containing protein n=1 Tax=Rhodopirellula halodulae TaxID=2894198 RepID=UPI001E37B3B6|nr:cupin domain-containing protein [Rhodopirellula sp. JC737]MCC9658453.1 cupin domain-containing protein [Rhodopirellula sp. JC737]
MEPYNFQTLDSKGRRAQVISRSEWGSSSDQWNGALDGKTLGTKLTVLFYCTETVGEGPRWHVHPYDEVFIVRRGRALFTIGDQKVEASEGDVLMGPADVPHKYHNLGPGKLETTDIHLSDRWIQANLDDPEL